MCVISRRIAVPPIAALALLVAGANSHAVVIPTVIDGPLELSAGTHQLVGDTTITTQGQLVCKPRSVVKAPPGALLKVYGILQATSATFTSLNPPSKWGGIEFRTTKSSQSRLIDCHIDHAGGSGHRAAVVCIGSLTVFPAPRLEDCRITRSGGDGVRSIGGRPELASCVITDCTGIAIRNTLGGYVFFASPCREIVRNGSNTVSFDKQGHGVIFPQVWKPAGRPYRVLGSVGTRRGGRITIKAGVELRMGNAACLIADRGPINAYGTARDPIIIRGTRNWPGQWGGIFIKPGGAPSFFRHCKVRHGGANTCCCGKAPHLVAIGATRQGGVTVKECTFTNGAGPGIWVENALVNITGSEVTNHADMGVVVLGTGQLTVDNSRIEANGRAGVYNASSGTVRLTPENELLRNGQFDVVNMAARNIDARGNNWGVTTRRAIARRIYDGRDAPGLGIVNFADFATVSTAATADATATALAITSATAVAANAGTVQITYALSAPGEVEAEVLNIAGRPVRRLAAQQEGVAGLNTLLWNGKSDTGLSVPAGRYLIRLRATGLSGEQAQATATAIVPAR